MSKHDFVNEDVKQRAEERCECGEETSGHASDANMADGGDAKADKMADKADSSSEPEIEAATPQQEAADDKAAEVSAEELVEQWRDKYLRLQAEFDNYRKRTLREKMDLVSSGGADVLKSMLSVLDDVQRAVAASEKSEDIAALREGERLVAQKFEETLRQKGVVEIEAVGEEFNPDFHEAVARFKAGDEKKGKVIDVIQRGYMLGDKVLRYVKVVVGE